MMEKLGLQSGLFLAAIFVGVTFLVAQAYSVHDISHDDGISYLAATGHQGQYATALPEGQWVQARQWQAFWTPEQFWIFTRIGRDLAAFDIHPPLYFWMLHIWISIVGVANEAGPLLNIPFHLITFFAITVTCRLLRCSRLIAGSIGLLWLFSGSNLMVAAEARQYSLLGMVSALFILALLCFLQRPSRLRALLLLLAITAGILTHYHFFLLLLTCGGMAALQKTISRQRRSFYLFAGYIAAAIMLFVALHPTFYLSLERQAWQAQSFQWVGVPYRILIVFQTLLELFIPHGLVNAAFDLLSPIWLPALVTIVAATAVIVFQAHYIDWKPVADRLTHPHSIPLVGGLTCLVLVALLYITFQSPGHAMSAKYIMLVTPVLTIAAGQFFSWLDRHRKKMSVALLVALLISQSTYGLLVTFQTIGQTPPPDANPLETQDVPVVVDSTARGVLPTILWHVNPESPIFAGQQQSLLKDGIPGLEAYPILLYVADLQYGNSETEKEAILQMFIDQGYSINSESVKTDEWSNKRYVYELQRGE